MTRKPNRWYTCTKRTRYATREQARARMEELRYKRDNHAYLCPYCDGWHIAESSTARAVYDWQSANNVYWGNQL